MTTQKESSIKTNLDGSTTITSSMVSKNVKSEIKLDSDTKVKVSEIDAGQDDIKYLEVIKQKNQLAILKDSNHYICMLSLKMWEDILKKMGSNLTEEINLIAFGIYSLEEINEIRKSVTYDIPKVVFENVTKYLEFKQPIISRINKSKNLNNKIFENIQEKLDFIKKEEERKRKEEEERKRKIEEENRKQKELKEKRREKAKAKLKKIRQDNEREILLKKFRQYWNNIQGLKVVETKKTTETEKKVLRLKIKKDQKDKNKTAEEERKKKEEEEKKKKEEEERKKKEEEERKRKEEEERKRKEEEERKRIEEEERKRKEEERKRKEEERKRKEEEERKRKEDEERIRKEEEERKRKEEERKRKEDEERKRKEEEERKRKEEEDKRLKLEEEFRKKKEEEYKRQEEAKLKKQEEERKKLEEKLKKEKEEEERMRIDEENRKKKEVEEKEKIMLLEEKLKYQNEEEEKRNTELEKSKNQEQATNIESTTIELKDNNTNQKLRGTNKNINNNIINSSNKKEKDLEQIDSEQKPKKKKVIKKVKKIIKIPKKNLETFDNRKPFYISGSTSISGGGLGQYHQNVTYTGHISKSHFSTINQYECSNCHNKYNNNLSQNNKETLFICENCANKVNSGDKNKNKKNDIKTLHSYEYYQNMNDDKYDPINTKEFYELYRNKYLSELWNKENEGLPHGKKGIKAKSIERINKNKIDEEPEFDKYINGFTTERFGAKDENNNENNDNINNNRKIRRCRNNSTEMRHNLRYKNINDNNLINGIDNNEDINNNLRLRNKKYIDNNEIQNIENINNNDYILNKNTENKNDIKEMNCPFCKNSYVLTRDVRFYNCSDCNNIMCGKCSKEHYLKYPDHNCSKADMNLSYEFNNINNSQTKEKKKRKINVRKYINKNQSQIEENIINNNIEKKNSEINKEKNGGDFNYDDCFLCGIKQRDNTQDKFYICRECDHLLCHNCRKKHDLISPNHNLVVSYISGEINKDLNNEEDEHICIHCQNKLNNNEENEIYDTNKEENINNNLSIKLRKEKINQNIQNIQMIQNIQNNSLDNNNKNKEQNYPYKNVDYNMKTQYQNDYGDKYLLYKNIINNNNKEYYNPINEYENIENDKETNKINISTNNNSPTKKRILIKRYQNDNKENKDLLKERKCKIEFDLNKDETEFDKCEIYGNPVCYNCLKSKKEEKNFKIFYCSQCMKLFCKDCLYQHNYI